MKPHTVKETGHALKISKEDKRLIQLLHEFSGRELSREMVLKELLSKAEAY